MTCHPLRIGVVALLATVLSAMAPPPASANDTSVGAIGGRLQALQETRITMVREEITLARRAASPRWQIDARYWFENRSDETVELQLGFPEQARCMCDDCDWSDPAFYNMQTWADGRELTQEVTMMHVTPNREHPQDEPCQARVFVYDLTFAPGQTLQVTHRYEHANSRGGGPTDNIVYVTTTGANWNGPIEHARFTIQYESDPPDEPTSPFHGAAGGEVYFTTDLTLASRREYFDGPARVLEFVLEAEDWMPEHDLWVGFFDEPSGVWSDIVQNAPYDTTCVEGGWLARQWQSYAVMYQESFRVRTDAELRRIRNAPYAAHGFAFESRDLNEHFYVEPWEVERREPRDADYPLGLRALPFAQNPDYSDALLYDVERECIDLVRAEERRRAALNAEEQAPADPEVEPEGARLFPDPHAPLRHLRPRTGVASRVATPRPEGVLRALEPRERTVVQHRRALPSGGLERLQPRGG